ncbi:unnamed protein product [Rotaria sordida]|uniref:Uncharacterized protein n=1 Tax=Rotaria sordida TaxID=392033 RepID=A0A814F4B4_9BILA|nr:unnamed protein product [Rotaria sordida]
MKVTPIDRKAIRDDHHRILLTSLTDVHNISYPPLSSAPRVNKVPRQVRHSSLRIQSHFNQRTNVDWEKKSLQQDSFLIRTDGKPSRRRENNQQRLSIASKDSLGITNETNRQAFGSWSNQWQQQHPQQLQQQLPPQQQQRLPHQQHPQQLQRQLPHQQHPQQLQQQLPRQLQRQLPPHQRQKLPPHQRQQLPHQQPRPLLHHQQQQHLFINEIWKQMETSGSKCTKLLEGYR